MPAGTSLIRTLALLALLGSGCCRNAWREPRPLKLVQLGAPRSTHAACADAGPSSRDGCSLDWADPAAALAAARSFAWQATRADRADDPCAVDLHYQAACAAWQALQSCDSANSAGTQACEIYHASLARFIATAQEHGRLVPGHGVVVNTPGGTRRVPFVPHGFVWQGDDFQAMYPVGSYKCEYITRQYRCPGWGVPIVVERCHSTGHYAEESFLPPGGMFAATAMLRPCPTTGEMALELFDPLRVKTHPELPAPVPMASDISAPPALREVQDPQLAAWFAPFVNPTRLDYEGLFLVEPYQPGKTPIVMVHGLASNPLSWIDLANDLRAIPGFSDRFQIWGFRYATGKPFLESAARLRHDLYRIVATVDPQGQDAALANMVLVGHSMGGLICKMQVASSEDRLWYSIANQPLEAICTSEATRQRLRQLCFFEPQPYVRRVIFLATPHRGSVWAKRPVGRFSSALVRPDQTQTALHEQLRRDNPGVFSPEVSRRIPTSVDMLNPDSLVLQTIDTLPLAPCVTFHSVIGYGYCNLGEGDGDKVVSVQSANFPCAESQIGVHAKHTQVQRQLETSEEVARILREHLAATDCQAESPDSIGHRRRCGSLAAAFTSMMQSAP